MSTVFCNEFKGWCKSFTKLETLLCIIQTISLIVFFAFLTFLILHLIVCLKYKQKDREESPDLTIDELDIKTHTHNTDKNHRFTTTKNDIFTAITTHRNKLITRPTVAEKVDIAPNDTHTVPTSSLLQEMTCTWRPSRKTEAVTHYYENVHSTKVTDNAVHKTVIEDRGILSFEQSNNGDQFDLDDYDQLDDEPDSEGAYDAYRDFLVALVKIKPSQDFTFGCALTIVSAYWTLTAASCIEAIEEVDSLDSFVMMQGFGDNNRSRVHPVSDVAIHPQFLGVNMTYDLAALKCEDNLVEQVTSIVTLPTLIDYYLITIGERLTVLGYGTFRSAAKTRGARRVRAAGVFLLPPWQCAAEWWAPRHLAAGRGVWPAACGARPLCAGVLRQRAAPCDYCAGTPLLRRRALLGIMSDNRLCGLACEPAVFVNVAFVRDWIYTLLGAD